LTFNYWRKGGYSIGSEDYRWSACYAYFNYSYLIPHREVLQKKISPPLFFLFNVTFISLAQSILLFLISTPTYVMLLTARIDDEMSSVDIMIARLLMGLIMVEFFADQQQWGKYSRADCESPLT
jgi:steroid 5-alpha reductase family enzyme